MHRRPPRLLGTALIACVPVLGLLLAFGPTAGASTTSASPSARIAAARAFLEHLGIGRHASDQRAPGQASKVQGLTKVKSTNWSGYADTGSGFTSVKGHWTQPSAKCGSAESLAAFWVGIDGFSSDSVEQDGTLILCDGGTASYYSWWEMYPTNDIQVVGETVAPGDKITASVTRSGTSYKLSLTDSTNTANSFSTTQKCTDCDNSSAEWIAEAPCCKSGSTPYPLSHFSTFTVTSASVKTSSKSGVISSFTDDEITMVNGSTGKVEAQPGALNSAGNSFKVTWKSA
jgi:Peptidase A4 family